MNGRCAPADESLLHLLRRTAARRPEAVAVLDRSVRLTWSTLLRAVTRGALRLREGGIVPGDRVLIHFDRSAYFAAAYLAVHAAGGVCVIAGSDSPAMAAEAAARTEAALVLTLGDGSWNGPSISVESLCGVGPERGPLPEIRLEGTADILYTTGTAGEPKGVVLTHSNVSNAALNTCTLLHQDEEDVELCTLPLTHSFGLGRLRCMVHAGSALIIGPGLQALGEMFDVARERRVTGMPLTPAGLALLRRRRADKELAALGGALRFIELLGAPIAPEVRDWAVDRLPDVRLCHHYGLTEASRAAGVELSSPEARAGSIGRPAPNVSIEVRDPAGDPVACGEQGELWIRGAVVAHEYWRQPELTATTFVGGAVRTRDLGRVDAEGRIFLHGRLSDLINVGGIKVAPQEVEAAIAQHPDVLEVACTAIADPAGISGERVAAFIVASRPIELGELAAWLRGRGIDTHRTPAYVERVAALPRSPSGKLLRRMLTRGTG